MTEWTWWAALAVSSGVTFWIGTLLNNKRQQKADMDGIGGRMTNLEKRIAVIEATQVDPQRVKTIVDESLEATNVRLDKIEETLETATTAMINVQLQLAALTGNQSR